MWALFRDRAARARIQRGHMIIARNSRYSIEIKGFARYAEK